VVHVIDLADEFLVLLILVGLGFMPVSFSDCLFYSLFFFY